MPQRELELVLVRQLASHLSTPILIVDRNIDLVFFNEPAEPILGLRFEDTGEIRRHEWDTVLRATDAGGTPIRPEERPLAIAVDRGEACHRHFWIRGGDGVNREIEGTAFPLGEPNQTLGAVGVFWERSRR